MQRLRLKVIRTEKEGDRTLKLYLTKPAGFKFIPGQFIRLILPDKADLNYINKNHQFSLASAPFEKDLIIITRVRDTSYKKKLVKLTNDTIVEVEGPFGKFGVLPETTYQLVFIAGGVGITPFRSILLDVQRKNLNYKIILFYFNKSIDEAISIKELKRIEEVNKKIKIVLVSTDPYQDDHNWIDENGYFSKALLTKYVKNLIMSKYFIAGPPKMVLEVKDELQNIGIKNENIHFELFTGY